jgi:DNA-binding transcriptional ArsR family regulator
MAESEPSPTEADRDRIFRALAATPRRRLLLLLTGGERSVSDLASEFDISRPAVSKHLAVLNETGVVESRKEGRKNLYRLNQDPLQDALSWFFELDQYWAAHLDDIDEQLRSDE